MLAFKIQTDTIRVRQTPKACNTPKRSVDQERSNPDCNGRQHTHAHTHTKPLWAYRHVRAQVYVNKSMTIFFSFQFYHVYIKSQKWQPKLLIGHASTSRKYFIWKWNEGMGLDIGKYEKKGKSDITITANRQKY